MIFLGMRCDNCGVVLPHVEDLPKSYLTGQLTALMTHAVQALWRNRGHNRDFCPTCKDKQ